MARPRLTEARAKASGAELHNPKRFVGRKAPKRTRPIGEPYLSMTDEQKRCWSEMTGDMPWLHSAHRVLLRLACYHAARLEDGEELTVQATQVLSAILSKLGATPVDETKVKHADDEDDEDAGENFFKRPN